MDIVNNFVGRFGGSWIKVKLYSELPNDMVPTDTDYIRFCDAVERARQVPVLVDKTKIICLGGRYVFGGDPEVDYKALEVCHYKKNIPKEILKTTFDLIPKLRNINFIGLNTDDIPHLGVAGLCGNVIAKSYANRKIIRAQKW